MGRHLSWSHTSLSPSTCLPASGSGLLSSTSLSSSLETAKCRYPVASLSSIAEWEPWSGINLHQQKKPFSPDVLSTRSDEASPLYASRPSRSPEPSLPFISCVWCARTPHFPSKASDVLLATPPPPSAFLLYPPTYLLVYRPPAYFYQLRASGGPPRSPLTSSDLDLSAPVHWHPTLHFS